MITRLLFSCFCYTILLAAPVCAQSIHDKTLHYEVVRHLYRWYMDEQVAEKIVGKEEVDFYVKALNPELDKGDKSKHAEIVLPQLDMSVQIKKADYKIEELDLHVKNKGYKINRVSSLPKGKDLSSHKKITTDYATMRDYLFKTRSEASFPNDKLLEIMRAAAREEILEDLEARGKEAPEGDQILFLSPISPVSNEVWIYWQTGQMFVRFSSDMDLEEEAMWEHDELAVKLFDIMDQTVVTLDEVAGSNAYMTRDQVGRILFNCVVLGKHVTITAKEE